MAFRMMGKKQGMTQRFDAAGNLVVCTVIHVEPNVVTQIKKEETDGYEALQLGMGKIVTNDPRTVQKRVTKQLLGHFKKSNVEPRRYLTETSADQIDSFALGQELTVSLLEGISHVDVTGITKGKGFQGVVKRYKFAGGPAAHGSGFHRHAGSCGMRSTPGRTLPGHKKAGHMGATQVTVQNLKIVLVDSARNLLVVEGAIPGATGAVVTFAPSQKKKPKKAA